MRYILIITVNTQNNCNDVNRNKRSVNLIKNVFGASSALASASSSKSNHYYDYDYHDGYYPRESKSLDWWSVKKSIMSSLFRAAKALKGGAIAVKGKLIKGSGYLLEANGKLLQSKGEKIENLGKNLALSVTQSSRPKKKYYYQHYHHHLHHHHDDLSYQHEPNVFPVNYIKPIMNYRTPIYDYNIHLDHYPTNSYYSMIERLNNKLPPGSKVGIIYNINNDETKNLKRSIQKQQEKNSFINNNSNDIEGDSDNNDDKDIISTTTHSLNSFDKKVPSMKEIFYKLFHSSSSSSSNYLKGLQRTEINNVNMDFERDVTHESFQKNEPKIHTTHFY